MICRLCSVADPTEGMKGAEEGHSAASRHWRGSRAGRAIGNEGSLRALFDVRAFS